MIQDSIPTSREISDFFDNLVVAFEEIIEETRGKISSIHILAFYLAATCKALGAQWASIVKCQKAKIEGVASTDSFNNKWISRDIIKLFGRLLRNKRVTSIESECDRYTYLKNTVNIYNLAIVPLRTLAKGTENRILLIGNKKHRIGLSEDLPYYTIPLLRFLSIFFGLILSDDSIHRYEVWRASLSMGSRRSVNERARELLSLPTVNIPVSILDAARASEIDTSVMLGIVPHEFYSFFEKGVERQDSEVRVDGSLPLTRLASLRRGVWQAYQVGEPYQPLLEEWRSFLRAFQEEFINEDEPLSIIDPPIIIDSVLDYQTNKYLCRFSQQKHRNIELLRTHLFLLHHSAHSLEGVADKQDIVLCDDVFRTKIGSETLPDALASLLGQFLDEWGTKELIITSEWLVLWFGLRILKAEDFVGHTQVVTRYTPNQRARFYRQFSTYFLYLLFLMRYSGEPRLFRFSDVKAGYESFVDAELFLLSEYTHQEERLDRSIPLYNIISRIWSSEAISYTVQEGYRDHHHHVWNVCLLGLVLIEAGLMERLCPIDESRKKWILTGLLHDIGYSASLNKQLIAYLSSLLKAPYLTKFLNNLQSSFGEAEKILCEKLNELAKSFSLGVQVNSLDHGLVSALYVLFLDQVHQSQNEDARPGEEWSKEISEAIEAIGSHNLAGSRLSATRSPLAFLLLLCDHLQEWDRPRFESNRFRRYVSASLQRPGQLSVAGNTLVRHLGTNLVWRDRKVSLPERGPLKLTLCYRDAARERFEPALIWCQNSFEFQRVAFEEWPEGFEIQFCAMHPVSSALKTGVSLLEMDLFEDFTQENEQFGIVTSWFRAARSGSNGMTYQAQAGVSETFCWSFSRDLQRSLMVEDFPSGIYFRYVDWKDRQLRAIKLRKRRELEAKLRSKPTRRR